MPIALSAQDSRLFCSVQRLLALLPRFLFGPQAGAPIMAPRIAGFFSKYGKSHPGKELGLH
jgi:hypothetical protein